MESTGTQISKRLIVLFIRTHELKLVHTMCTVCFSLIQFKLESIYFNLF